MLRSAVLALVAVVTLVGLTGCSSEPSQEEADAWFSSASDRPPISDTDFGSGAQVGAEPFGASFELSDEPSGIMAIHAACLGDGHRATIEWHITPSSHSSDTIGAAEEIDCSGAFVELSSAAKGLPNVDSISVQATTDGERIPVLFAVLAG